MLKKMAQTALKKQLQSMSADELIYLVSQIYKTCPDANNFLNVELGNEEYLLGMLEEAKAKVRKEFYPARGYGRLSLAAAKKAMSDFSRVCRDWTLMMDLWLFYVECGVEFTNDYGDISEPFYNSMINVYEKAVDELNAHDDESVFRRYESRLKAIVEETSDIGWGFHDGLESIFGNIKWVRKESS